MRKKLILDLDTGIDDALAIAYALGSADETISSASLPHTATSPCLWPRAMRLRCSTHLDAMTYRCIPASTTPSHPRSCH